MQKDDFLKSKTAKILIPVCVTLGAIMLFKNGYSFGQWLYVLFN